MYQESEKIELKSSLTEWRDIVITLCAFANKKGGTVIVGVNDRGEPLRLTIGKKTLEDLANKIIFILHHKKGGGTFNIDRQVAFNLRNFSQIRFSDRKKLKREIFQKMKESYGL